MTAVTDREAILRFCRSWADAIVSNDAAVIGDFMTTDWTIVGPDGPTSRDAFLASVANGEVTHDHMSFVTPPDIRIHGAVAIVIARIANGGQFNGTPFTADEWTTDVLVREEGRWLCAASHITAARSE